jgi:hypothetical protein
MPLGARYARSRDRDLIQLQLSGRDAALAASMDSGLAESPQAWKWA